MLTLHRPPVFALVAGLMAVGCAKRPAAPVPAASTPASLPAAPSAEQLRLTDGAGGLIGSEPTPGGERRPVEPGQVHIGDDFAILGALDASRITAVIEQQLSTITHCYRSALAEEPDTGRDVTLRVQVPATLDRFDETQVLLPAARRYSEDVLARIQDDLDLSFVPPYRAIPGLPPDKDRSFFEAALAAGQQLDPRWPQFQAREERR